MTQIILEKRNPAAGVGLAVMNRRKRQLLTWELLILTTAWRKLPLGDSFN